MNNRPRLLDLFCGAGGCAVGSHRAGFRVVGVDHKPQPHFKYRFRLADAMEYVVKHSHKYDAIHASPPCQHYSKATNWRGNKHEYPDLIDEVRELLNETRKPWII